MKKIILSLTGICMLSLSAQLAYSSSFKNYNSVSTVDTGGKKKEISIGSNRATGDMLLHFTADKAGKASISLMNESGEIVLQQTNQVSNSNNSIPLKNATKLAEGSYTLRLILNNQTYTTRFLIWK